MTTTLKIGQELHSDSIVYRIESVLGQGSFGVTYKAKAFMVMKGKFGEELVETNTPKAIKEFFMREINQRDASGSITGISEGSLSYNYAQKFKKEAENLAGMSHPNIVKVIDFVTANNTFYYVMDYIEGENLNEYLKRHKMSEQEAVETVVEVAKALRYMHEQKHMLHLDLKPGNIMRRRSDGHIFLIDFGLSKHYNDDGQPDTSTTIGLGTEGYAPIEQGKKASAQNAFRPTIDVYALGGTLFKLLTGETPPSASDILDDEDLLSGVMKKHNVNPHLQDIIVKAMQPTARRRTASVTEFLKEFNPITDDIRGKVGASLVVNVASETNSPITKNNEETEVTYSYNNQTNRGENITEVAIQDKTPDNSNSISEQRHSQGQELPTLSFREAIKLLTQNRYSFNGRSRRSEYDYMMMVITPFSLLCFHYFFGTGRIWGILHGFVFINIWDALLIFSIIFVSLIGLSTTVRRLHDINLSGLWAIIPLTSLLVLLLSIYYIS